MKTNWIPMLLVALAGLVSTVAAGAGEPPGVGERAPAFELKSPEGRVVAFTGKAAKGPCVVLVLRGWPGYQCPLCTRQVREYLDAAADFAKAGARVVMVYPGPKEGLGEHGAEFVGGRDWPKPFEFALDPDFTMVRAYGLRWDAPGETAYPSTFVIDRAGVVRFVKISRTHGDRTRAADVLGQVSALPRE